MTGPVEAACYWKWPNGANCKYYIYLRLMIRLGGDDLDEDQIDWLCIRRQEDEVDGGWIKSHSDCKLLVIAYG